MAYRKITNPDSRDIILFGKTVSSNGFIVCEEGDANLLQNACSTLGSADASAEDFRAYQQRLDEEAVSRAELAKQLEAQKKQVEFERMAEEDKESKVAEGLTRPKRKYQRRIKE